MLFVWSRFHAVEGKINWFFIKNIISKISSRSKRFQNLNTATNIYVVYESEKNLKKNLVKTKIEQKTIWSTDEYRVNTCKNFWSCSTLCVLILVIVRGQDQGRYVYNKGWLKRFHWAMDLQTYYPSDTFTVWVDIFHLYGSWNLFEKSRS